MTLTLKGEKTSPLFVWVWKATGWNNSMLNLIIMPFTPKLGASIENFKCLLLGMTGASITCTKNDKINPQYLITSKLMFSNLC